MSHTNGSHCDPRWAVTAGSWWSEPCHCDKTQSNAIGTVPPSISYTVPSNNAAATVPALTYTMEYWVTAVPYNPAPIHIHYCQHEEINKNLLNLIEKLVNKIARLEDEPVPPQEPPENPLGNRVTGIKPKTGISQSDPVKETIERKN